MNEQKGLFTQLGETLDQYRAERRGAAQEQMPSRRPGWLRRLLPTPGNVLFTLLVVVGLIWANSVGALPLRAPLAASTSTGTIAYQGRLADADGTPITDTVNMEFRLYDVASGGIFLWEELWTGSNSVEVSDGLFNVMLGSMEPIPQSVITEHDSLFLGITVGTDDEMTPRVQLGSVPFAVQALTVPDGSVTTEKIADEAVTQAKLGSDVSLEPPDGSITTAKIADGAVTSAKLEHSGPHIPITPDENGLVKMAVMRQDRTTDVYSNNQVILTGWNFVTGDGSNTGLTKAITFGITFGAAPVVVISNLGIKSGSDPTSIDDLTSVVGNYHAFYAYSIATTGFNARIDQEVGAPFGNGDRIGFSWIAIGTLE